MKCVVKNCGNEQKNKDLKKSFFLFPREKEQLKKWIQFCKNSEPFKAKTWRICMDHFKEEDIYGSEMYKMGYAVKRTLKPGAIPCIYDIADGNSERIERVTRRENKQVVASLLQSEKTLITTVCKEEVEIPTVELCPDFETQHNPDECRPSFEVCPMPTFELCSKFEPQDIPEEYMPTVEVCPKAETQHKSDEYMPNVVACPKVETQQNADEYMPYFELCPKVEPQQNTDEYITTFEVCTKVESQQNTDEYMPTFEMAPQVETQRNIYKNCVAIVFQKVDNEEKYKMMEQELKLLKSENSRLQDEFWNTKIKFEYEISELKKKVAKTEFQRKNLEEKLSELLTVGRSKVDEGMIAQGDEISMSAAPPSNLTVGQINKLKNGLKRQNWSKKT